MKQRISGIQTIYREGVRRLAEAGIEEAKIDAWYLLEYVTGIDRASYYGDPDKEIGREKEEQFFSYISKRCERIPLQHLTGEQEFMGLPFFVNEYVLIPRQDTEVLVEEALRKMSPGMSILDMCTGSGCILLSLLSLNKKYEARGTGADISPQALEVAEKNAGRLCIEASFIQSNLFESLDSGEKFDLIVSNPPYIPTAVIEELQTEVRLYDPYIALDGREDGLYFYREIIKNSVSYIKKGGWLMFEIGYDQAESVSGLMKMSGYENISVKKDLASLDRVVMGMYNGQ